VITDKS